MTKARIIRLVNENGRRLRLTGWRIMIELDAELSGDTDAEVAWDWSYDNATIRFSEKWRTWDEGYARRVIVHELLHLLTRDLCVCVAEVFTALPEGCHGLARDRWDHELEGVVERVAVLLTDA